MWRVRDFVEWFDGRLVRNNTGGHQAQVRVDIVESLVNGGHIQFGKAHLLWSLRGREFLHGRKIFPPATTTASNQTSGTTVIL